MERGNLTIANSLYLSKVEGLKGLIYEVRGTKIEGRSLKEEVKKVNSQKPLFVKSCKVVKLKGRR